MIKPDAIHIVYISMFHAFRHRFELLLSKKLETVGAFQKIWLGLL